MQNAGLLEWLWDRADDALQNKLAEMEIIVLNPDRANVLKHSAKVVEEDTESAVRTTVQLVVDMLKGRPCAERHHDIPWKLVDRTAGHT